MKTPQIILTSLLLLVSLLLSAQNDRQWQWAHRAGGIGAGANGEPEEGSDIALDSENNVYVCGHTYAFTSFDTLQVNFNLADENIFLAKYHCDGGLAWVKVFGSSRSDLANSLTIDDADNVYITGVIEKGPSQPAILGKDTLNSHGGLYISKFDPEGNNIWNKISYSPTSGFYIDKGPDNTLYVYGRAGGNETQIFSQYTVGGIIGGRTFIIKMDTSGAIHWVKNYGDTTYAHKSFFNVQDMSVADNGDIYMAGNLSYDTLYFFSDVIVRKSDETDIILAKLDSSGQFQWVQRAGGSGLGSLGRAVITLNDQVYVSGIVNARNKDADFGDTTITDDVSLGSLAFLARYNPDGSVKWVVTPDYIQQQKSVRAFANDATSQGNIVWSGNHTSNFTMGNCQINTVGSIAFFAITDSNGAIVECFKPDTDSSGSKGILGATAIAGGYYDNIFFTGAFEERVVFNDIGDTINNDGGGDWDIIVAKYGSSDCSIPEDTLVDTNSVYTPMHAYKSLSFSPNPVSGNDVNLQLSDPLKESASVRLYSSTGSKVWQGELAAGNTNIRPGRKLKAGLYILELNTGEMSYTGKLMVIGER